MIVFHAFRFSLSPYEVGHSQNFKLAAGLQDGVVESLDLVSLKIPESRTQIGNIVCRLDKKQKHTWWSNVNTQLPT